MTVVPMLLGYAMGAIGVYALLYRFAPIQAEDAATHAGRTQVINLFEDESAVRRAA